MKMMASGLITYWQIDGQTMEILTDFIFVGSQITADGDCSHEIKRCLFLRSPAQVGCMRQALGPGAQGKPRGSGWRGRWEGGSGWGTHVNPWLFYSNVWQNSLQIKKKKEKKKMLVPCRKSYDQPRQHIKKQRHYFTNKGPSGQSYGFARSHVCLWELDCEESWAPKNWCFWTVVLEKTLQSPLECKRIKPVNPKGNQSWIFIRRTDAKGDATIFWSPDVKNWFIGKDPDSGKGQRQEKKRTTKDEMIGWHHWLNGHAFEQTLGVANGQGSLVCCSPWGCKESDMTESLNCTD